jgi:hypothetical protein
MSAHIPIPFDAGRLFFGAFSTSPSFLDGLGKFERNIQRNICERALHGVSSCVLYSINFHSDAVLSAFCCYAWERSERDGHKLFLDEIKRNERIPPETYCTLSWNNFLSTLNNAYFTLSAGCLLGLFTRP